MRYVFSATATAAVIAFKLLAPSIAFGQAGLSDLSITNYQFVDEQRVTRTQFYETYRADLVNRGVAPLAATATVTSLAATVVVVAGQGTLHFPVAQPNGQVTSLDTFTLLVDRSVPFDFASLKWSFLNPVANAGPNQTAQVGKTVTLNGSGSSNPSGVGTLSYSWAFKSRPAASNATLSGSSGVLASFVVDVAGAYAVTLTVSNGTATDSATVTISTVNSPPVANAGPNQTVAVGAAVTLNGSASSDVDGDPLTYLWSLITKPAGSSAGLSSARSPSPTFVADKAGTYVAQLVVNDGIVDSAPATVTITTANTAPVANAGPNQTVTVGTLVQLTGAGSTDVDGNPLTFKWSFNSVPSGSTASLSSVTAVNPTFTADRAGTYVVQLIVNDGQVDSQPATVTVTTNAQQAPVANPGPNQTVVHGAIVTLSGFGTDPQGLPLTLTWSLITRPPNSVATLSSTSAAHPTFLADQPGTYVAQLIVSNGFLSSQPATVTITTTNTPPVAVAGVNQSVASGVTVFLDGSASWDADNDPLTYSWSLTNRPASSTTTLQGAVTKTPSFFADMPGTYVAQLIVNDGFTNSSPSTVTITAGLLKVTLSPNPLNLQNLAKTLTITLSTAAGAGGVPVSLSGFDPSVISLPATVTVPQNGTVATVTVTPLFTGSTNILATAPGYQPGTTAVTVATPTITVTLTSAGVGLTHSINGTITLNAPADVGGVTIGLSSNPVGRVTFDTPNVVIPAGGTTGTFKVIGGTLGTATITAAAGGYVSGTASILVVNLGGVFLPSGLAVAPGQSAALSVTLTTPAPVDGVTVTLASSDTGILGVTPSVFIAPGATTPSTAAQVTGVAYGSVTVTASAGGYTGDSQTVKVSATLSFSTQVVSVGAAGDQSINVLLSAPAPAGGLPITLQSSNTAIATVPPSVVIAAGSTTSPSFLVHGVAAGSATITASATAPNVASATLPVTVSVFGSIGLPSGVTVGQSQSVPFPITLSAAAPAGGVTVTLSTSNSSIVDISPKLVTITAGQTQPGTQPQVTGNGLGQATITATAPGYGSASQPVTGNTTLSFVPASLSITGLETKDFTLTLPVAAPAGGITVNLTASPTGVVTVPASVQIAQNTTTATVHVTGVAPGTATVTAAATSPNIGNATGSVTVLSAGAIGLPSNVSLALGESKAFAVTLPVAAPQGGVIVTLTSDSPKVGISPGTVTIGAGQTQPAAQPQVTGNSPGTANITASAPAYTSTTKAVQVTATISFTPPSLSLSGTNTQNLTLTLSGPAPSGGLVFNVSSTNTSVATVGSPTATIQGGATTTTIAVTAVAAGSAVIHASAANLTDATANVTVTAGADIIVPASLSVAPGESVILPITLANPAQSLMFFDLTSSDPTKATLSTPSITIPAGQTVSSNVVRIIGVATGATTIKVKATNGTLAEATTAVTVGYSLTLTPATLTILGNGNLATLTLTLSGPAPAGGIDFTLTSSNPAVATVPPSVTMSATSSSIGARVISVGVGTTVIHVNAPNIPEATATVTVAPPGSISLSAPATIGLSQTGTLTVALSSPATGNGVSVDLTSSDPNKVSVSPTTVNIPSGSTTPVTQPQLAAVNVGNVTISASAQGFTSSAPVPVAVNATITWISQNTTIVGIGNQVLLQLRLNAMAPLAGLTVNMTSSNPAVATVQGISNFIWDGSTSPGILIPVTSVGFGTTIIHASGINIPDVTTTVTVSGPLGITTTSPLPNGILGAAYSAAMVATGGSTPYTWTATGLPAGLAINPSSGVITGTPTAAGPATANVTVTDASSPTPASVTKQFSITIVSVLTITTSTLPNGVTGSLYSGPLAAVGGVTPYAWTATGLPGGLGIDPGTGAITGTPTAAGAATIVVTVTDATSPTHLSATKSFPVIIVAPLTITTTALPNGVVGAAYSGPNTATGGITPYAWTATGLPAGLGIDPGTGAITGTPTATAAATIVVTVTDSFSPTHLSATKSFPVSIVTGIAITTPSLPNGVVGSVYNGPLTATGGTTPYAWTATGLPGGLGIDPGTGAITGTPTAAGAATIVVTVTDATSPTHLSATKSFPVIIVAPLTITTTALPNGVVGAAYSGPNTATGGITPYAWTATGLPAGLGIDPGTGAITGTPTATAAATIVVTVTDSFSPTHLSATKSFPVSIVTGIAITTPSLPNGVVGSVYNGPLTATGGTTPYAWTATGLPGGLGIDPGTGAITGTPTAAGAATIVVTVTDATSPTHLSATKSFPVIIVAPLTITTTSLPNGVAGAAYSSGPLTATGGTTPYAWTATGLPAGLGIDPGTGAITGTPAASGAATIIVTVTDSFSPTHLSANKSFPVTFGPALGITTPSLPNGAVGSVYNSGPLTATGGTTPYAWTATGLPAGLGIDPGTGTITGTPTAAGAATISVTVTDATSPTHLSATKQFPVTIVAVITITTPSLPNGAVGAAYSSGPLTATGGATPYAWTATGLPAGLGIDPGTGAITGTPTASVAATIIVTVTDATNPTHLSATKQFPVTISAGLAIATPSLPNGVVGSVYSGPLTATGGNTPYAWTATGLPGGLSINPNSGAITGTPTVAGDATISVTVTDATNPTHLSATKQFPVTIVAALTISTTALPNGVATAPYSFTVIASGGNPTYTWGATGLPTGLTIDPATGAITGTTTVSGTSTVNITVTDTTSPTNLNVSHQFPLIIMPALQNTTLSLADGLAGSVYNQHLSAFGGTPPYVWTATGLPAGLSIDSANSAIIGTPTAAGTVTVSLTVTDATSPAKLSALKNLSLTIQPALAFNTTSPLPGGLVGSAYNFTLTATGGTVPYVWTQTGLPAGLNLDSASGIITGTPTTAGTVSANITVTDATTPTHQSVSRAFSITIAAALTITTTSLPNGKQGTAYAGSMAATGGTLPYTWSATGLPAGLSIDPSSGAVTGTPSVQGGPFNIAVQVVDSTTPTHQSASKQVSITIDPGTLVITTPSLPGGQVGAAYNQTLATTGGTTPFHWSATGLPTGLSINASTGQITGSPTVGGTSSVNLTVTDSGNPVQTATKTLSIVVQNMIITTAALPQATAGLSYVFQLTASGGAGQLTWSVNVLPRNLVLDPLTGIISGIPNNPSSSPITFTVTDSSIPPQTASKDLLLTVVPVPVVIATATLPVGVLNAAYSTPLAATGGTLPYTWSTTTILPLGLVFSSGGVLSGTPTVPGTTSVTITVTDGATIPQVVSKTFQLNIGIQNGVITVSNATVGANLQLPITITFAPPLPIDSMLTVSSGNSSLVTLGSGAVVGDPSIQSVIAAGTPSVNTFVKAFGSSGQVTITASVPGYSIGTGTVTLANSGFVVAGPSPNGIGGAYTTFQGVSSTLTVFAARLDGSGLFVESEQLRGGITVNVPIISTVTNIGDVSSPTVPFSGGSDNATTQFVAKTITTGVTNVIVGPVSTVFPVAPFTQPSVGASLTVTVNGGGLVPFTGATIGRNLQKTVSVGRLGSTLNNAAVTVHSQDATKLLFSKTPTGATSADVILTIPTGQSTTPDFYAHALSSTGPVAYTVSSPAYGSVDSTLSLAPSGFFVTAPSPMTVSPPNATVSVSTVWLDGTGSPQEIQAVASGVSISVAVASSNSLVGNVTVSPITIGAGSSNASTEFQAVGLGTAQITASAAGYGSGSVGVSVQGAGSLIVSNGLTIGQFLQDTGTVILPVVAPVGGLHVTLHSNSPLLMLSKTATGAGAATIAIDFVQGQGNAPYFVQSLGSSSTATYTATAPGYGPGTDTVTMVPSGIVILGPGSVSLAGGPQSLTVFTAQLSASNVPVVPQALAGGASLTVSLTNSPGVAGSVPASVTVAAGASSTTALFTPLVAGISTTVSVVQPSGWTVPTTLTSLGISVF